MARRFVLAGPGCFGAGKSQFVSTLARVDDWDDLDADDLAAGEFRQRRRPVPERIVIDAGEIYEALGGDWNEGGRDPARLRLAMALRDIAINEVVSRELDAIITSSNGDRQRLDQLAAEAGAEVLVLAPPREEMCRRIRRLVPSESRQKVCEQGLDRWYERYTPAPTDHVVR